MVGENYQLRYWIDAGASYDSGWWNWTATQEVSVMTLNWTLPDAVVGYHLHGELELDGLWLANVESDAFDIVANNNGGGNTGCSYDLNYSYLIVGAYQMNMPLLYENQSFIGTYRPMCSLYEMNHSFSGYLAGPSANDISTFTMDSYLQSSQAFATQYQIWDNLEVGTYSFFVEWNLNQSGVQTFVDDGWFNFTVISNTSTAPGSSQSNPLMPFNCSDINWNGTGVTLQDCQNNPDSFWFVFNNTGGTFWIDPVVAIGYDYIVWSGPNISSVTLPTGYGDDIYDLYMWNNTGWYDTGLNIDGGETYTFTEEFGVDRLSIRGIEAYEELDPNNVTAFVTGLSFMNTNEVTMTMTPVTVNYEGNNTGGNNTILDADGDGVLDADDYCPNSTPGASVDSTGCEASVQPVNNPPEVTNVIITPLIATVDDTLTCGYSTTDSDGDAVTTIVTWAVNGSIISAGSDTLSGGFGVGQTVTCSVVANDGAASSSPFISTTIILPSGSDEVVEDAGGLLPSLSMMGTLVAIAFGVGLSRRQDD